MQEIFAKRTSAVIVCSLLVFSLIVLSGVLPVARASGGDPVTLTKHVDLGFKSSVPLSFSNSGSAVAGIITWSFSFTGTADIFVKLGVDISITYNPADLVPGGSLPVTVTYTPTPGGSDVSYDASGSATVDFTGCTDCPATVPLMLAAGSGTFSAPMGSDSPITIPGSGSTIDFADILDASLASSLTLAPAPAGLLPGLGGAAALVQASGASGAPSLPLEWDTAGSTQSFTLALPSTPGPISISLGPIVHWIGTSGTFTIPLTWTSDFQNTIGVIADFLSAGICLIADCSLPNPGTITVFSGGLGPVYTSIGLDTAIGSAVGNAVGPPLGSTIGSDITTKVGAGFVPVPLLDPALSSIPPIPSSLGSISFLIPSVSISGAPSDVVLLGNSITLTASSTGGSGSITYSWTKNSVPFATTSSITDTPSLGSTTYSVTATDSLGAVSNTYSVTVNTYDFSMSVNPSSIQVLTSGSNMYSPGVSSQLVSGSYTSGLPTIGLDVTSGLPSGAVATFSPDSGTPSFDSSLTITTTNTPAGTYTITITGTDGRTSIGGTRTTTATLSVITPAQALPMIISDINGLVPSPLNSGQAHSLITKLNNAIGNLNGNKPVTACNQLNALVDEINSYVAENVLTQAQANMLLQGPLGIYAIMASVPC